MTLLLCVGLAGKAPALLAMEEPARGQAGGVRGRAQPERVPERSGGSQRSLTPSRRPCEHARLPSRCSRRVRARGDREVARETEATPCRHAKGDFGAVKARCWFVLIHCADHLVGGNLRLCLLGNHRPALASWFWRTAT